MSMRGLSCTAALLFLVCCACPSLMQTHFAVTAFSSNSFRANNAFGQTQRVLPKAKKSGIVPAATSTIKTTAALPTPSPDDPTVVAFIRSEYDAWVMQHNKTKDDDRFIVFKKNFLATLETFETTGKYHALNRFADLTPEEYKLEIQEEEAEMDAYVRSEYKAWREQYNKPPDEERYKVFKNNFLKTMKIFEETGKFTALNEHGDMTREDYLKMQTHLAIASSRREAAGAGGRAAGTNSGQEWNSNPYNMPQMQQRQSEAASYQRSEAMTFQPVTPRSTSDVLNSRGTSGTEYDIAYGIGGASGGGRETVDNSWGGGGGSMGGDAWGFGNGMNGAKSYAQPPSYAPSPAPSAPSFQRTEAMTFAPVSPRSTSDLLNTGGKNGGGGGLGSEWDIAYGRTSGAGGGMNSAGRPDWNQAAYSSGRGDSFGGTNSYGGGGGNSWGGRHESVAPMVGPPSNYPPTSRSDPYGGDEGNGGNSYQYERPSEMTFTPVTPKSTSDVLNNNRGSGRGSSDWDIAYGYGNRRGGSSGALGATASWNPSPAPPSVPASPPQPYKPTNPPGATFVPITPGSDSDMRNRPRNRSMSSTFSYVPTSPGSQNEVRNGINSFMGTGRVGGVDLKGNNNNGSIWNKVASAVDSLVGGVSKPASSPSRDNDDGDDFFSYLKQHNQNSKPGGDDGRGSSYHQRY
jgi:hypothetical protein